MAATDMLILPVGARDHTRGPDSAPVTLLEYGDFECPECAQAYRVAKQLAADYGPRLRVTYRHLPLTNIHPHAQRAAEAAEWAGTRGQFWAMHDALYEDPAHLADRDLLARARALGLDPASLEAAWAEHTFVPRVKEDFLSGIRSGAGGTPTFFVNGSRHEGAKDLAALSAVIAAAQRSG